MLHPFLCISDIILNSFSVFAHCALQKCNFIQVHSRLIFDTIFGRKILITNPVHQSIDRSIFVLQITQRIHISSCLKKMGALKSAGHTNILSIN